MELMEVGLLYRNRNFVEHSLDVIKTRLEKYREILSIGFFL
ncbi:hypothetical protein BVRB_3g058730 [Beta vulgaris subsp. vulgaris]|nr:hypothetical protein BVRB_3g058730 [Beta vulgaris subsp. vulgaris]